LKTPDGELLHSILVDPRDARHLYIGISIGGVFESMDAGGSRAPLNEGVEADFLPDPNVPFGHDPPCVTTGRSWQRRDRGLPGRAGAALRSVCRRSIRSPRR
jgi:hypothetical protein